MSSFIEKLPKDTLSVIDFVLIEYFNRVSYEGVSYQVHNQIILHITIEGPLRLPTMDKRIAE